MSKWLTLFAVSVALMVMTRSTLVFGQGTTPGPDRDSRFWNPQLLPSPVGVEKANSRSAPQPDFSLQVWVSSVVANDKSDAGKMTAALHERIKDFMNKAKLGVPEDRVRYFEPRWIHNPPISGWAGLIDQVKPIQDGYAVTLRINAVEGGGAYDNTHLYEHYTIVGGKVKYRGFTEPAPYYIVRGA